MINHLKCSGKNGQNANNDSEADIGSSTTNVIVTENTPNTSNTGALDAFFSNLDIHFYPDNYEDTIKLVQTIHCQLNKEQKQEILISLYRYQLGGGFISRDSLSTTQKEDIRKNKNKENLFLALFNKGWLDQETISTPLSLAEKLEKASPCFIFLEDKSKIFEFILSRSSNLNETAFYYKSMEEKIAVNFSNIEEFRNVKSIILDIYDKNSSECLIKQRLDLIEHNIGTLQDICKNVIRNAVNNDSIKIKELPLPKPLIRYLNQET